MGGILKCEGAPLRSWLASWVNFEFGGNGEALPEAGAAPLLFCALASKRLRALPPADVEGSKEPTPPPELRCCISDEMSSVGGRVGTPSI